jgi:hypothetical protein
MLTDVSLCATRKLAAGFGDFERSRAAGGPPQGRHAEARVGQPWPGLGRSARPGGTVAQPSDPPCTAPIIGRRCRVAASGSSQVARARLDGSTRAIQPHRIPALHCPGLSSHARIASRTCGGCQRLWFGRLRLLRGCSSHKRVGAWCVPDAPADSSARLSTVTPPRAAPPGLSFPACASPS